MAVFAAIVAALVISSVSAATYEVGDGLGWLVPPGGAVAYTTWASNHTFHAGDILGKREIPFFHAQFLQLYIDMKLT